MLLLTGNLDACPSWAVVVIELTNIVNGASFLALLVMNLNMYLATYHPVYHRTSVTKGKLLILLTIMIVFELVLTVLSLNSLVISYDIAILVFFIIANPPLLFFDCKLLLIGRKRHKRNEISPNIKKTFSFKNINSCLLAVACLVLLQIIPVFIYVGIQMSLDDVQRWDSCNSAALWAKTIVSTNSTFNCLIFYWKNTILRAEGIKVVKSLKICQRLPS